MKNYLLIIQYDGTAYNGWQRQKNTANTIQKEIENTLSGLLQEDIEIHGSGRTDRGVHAKGQTANFKSREILDLQQFLKDFNYKLPSDIKVVKISEVDINFHSRLSAVSKKYSYHICYSERPSVFRRKYVYQCEKKPNIEMMQKAVSCLLGVHDFRGLSSEKNLDKSCIRDLYDIIITEDKGELILCFHGSGFLYNMVRIITGTLLEIGTDRLTIEDLNRTLLTGKREYAGGMLPPNGLFLEQVYYD